MMAVNQQSQPIDLRVVLFGAKFAGKSSLINFVFEKKWVQPGLRTAQCKKLQGNVSGRNLILVDTPGWWKHFPLSDSPKFLKQELVHGLSLCHPGPHAVLLVIELDIPFTKKHKKAAQDHLGLLGDDIWKYIIIVFTRGHSLRDKKIEEHIRNEGEALQGLIEKCENRYHVFDGTVSGNGPRVAQLLEKIEEIVQRKNGAYFQVEAKILQGVSEWRQKVITEAKHIKFNVQKQRENFKKEELRIAVVGWVIAGKSSAGNTILNQRVFRTDETDVSLQIGNGEVDGRPITVINTPSWFKYVPSQYTPAWKRSEFIKGLSQPLNSPHCILLVIPADTSFKEEQKKVIQENMSLLGEQVWRHTIVLFTWGDILGDLPIDQHIESEGDALLWVIEKCGFRYHVFNNEKREDRAQVTELLKKIDEMVSRNSLFQLSTTEFNETAISQCGEGTQTGISSETDLQNIIQIFDEEWRRRDKELLIKLSKIKEDLKARGDASIDIPPSLREDVKEESQTEERPCKRVRYEDKNVSTFQEQVKQIFDMEWSRREEALMGRFMEMLSELRSEKLSEPTENEIERSEQKVSQWLQTRSEGYASLPDSSN